MKHFLKPLLPKNLIKRVLIIFILPLVLFQGLLLLIFYERHWQNIEKRLSRINAGDVAIIIEYFKENKNKDPQELEERILATMGLHVKFHKDATKYPSPATFDYNATEKLFMASIKEKITQDFVIDNKKSRRFRYVHVRVSPNILVIDMPYKRLFSSTNYVVVIFILLSSLSLIVIASIFLKNQMRPIINLAQAADKFGKGQRLDENDTEKMFIEPKGAFEVRQATKAFNNMIERINRQIKQRTDMLSGVSHDLRTPLTRMRLQIAMLDQTPETERLKQNLIDMEKMIEGYLAFAKGNRDEPSTSIDMQYFIERICQEWKSDHIDIDYHIEQRLRTTVKPNAVKRMLDNIINNSVQHSKHIWLSLAKRDDYCQIIIDDDGPGIKEEYKSKVFRPFYRIDQSRHRKTGGVGLGLTIAIDVARAHGGDVILDKAPQGGLRVIIKIPI